MPNSLIIIESKDNYWRNIYYSLYLVLVTCLLYLAPPITSNDSINESVIAMVSN